MTKLAWDQSGARFFETGVDRAVFYPRSGAGVAWNGLIGVEETPVGGDSESYYLDGVKYLDESSPEEYAAGIEAYTYPEEFALCDGMASFGMGLYVDHQPRQSFGLCYRTRIGNDIQGQDHAYKIHLVYNALASPNSRGYKTIGDSADPLTFKWNITTTPVQVVGHKYTAHIVLDSRETYPTLLSLLEDMLYGTESTEPRLPTASELASLFDVWMKVIDHGDGTWSITCSDDDLTINSDGTFSLQWPAANTVIIDANTYQLSSAA